MTQEGPPEHPTYGTLANLALEMDAALTRGEYPRMGHIGALSWFVQAYQTATPVRAPTTETRDNGKPE